MSTALTPSQRSIRARIGAYALHATGGTSTAAGTRAFLSRFEAQVDPTGTLAPEERARRATLARRAYFARLALASSRARTKKAAAEIQSPAAATLEGHAHDRPAA
jgi:hypothetical protein